MKAEPILLADLQEQDLPASGGKAVALARLMHEGLPVPPGISIPTSFYRRYLQETGIGERISLELNRKDFTEMRWEEIWDCALRIRSFFLRTPLPDHLEAALESPVRNAFEDRPVAVRSSAPGEDNAAASFAGLHETFVNIRGTEDILQKIRLVWASLWSDSALLYRHELGLEVASSAMAVVVQELVHGERSGVAFSMSPRSGDEAVIESVWGLNQGLVDGTLEPDRWFIDRKTGKILRHEPPSGREQAIRPVKGGTALVPLGPEERGNEPLNGEEVRQVFGMAMNLENLFGTPQDMEWTLREDQIWLLQARPVTTLQTAEGGDRRSWYLSLSRSYENLSTLGKRIETEWLPAMEREADSMAEQQLSHFDDAALATELKRRMERFRYWEKVYWDEFIPFAHGVRLFGQYYNDRFSPEDPFSFVSLLQGQDMQSIRRNAELRSLRDALTSRLSAQSAAEDLPQGLRERLKAFLKDYGPLPGITVDESDLEGLIGFLGRTAGKTEPKELPPSLQAPVTETAFLQGLPEKERELGRQLLELARKSWKLRDDDNIYLGRIEAQQERARKRLAERMVVQRGEPARDWSAKDLLSALEDPSFTPPPRDGTDSGKESAPRHVLVRQVRGQPAGPGITTGKARVITGEEDLADFAAGEVLICDAIDPTITFIVPMASAVVERRGGMLIHGAIIAREYGIPCVTGIPEVTRIVRTGDTVTVDGNLGLLIINERNLPADNILV